MKAQVFDMASAGPAGLGFSAVALLVLLGSATQPEAGVVRPGAPQAAMGIRLEPGLIAVRPFELPAQVSFEKADGQINYPGDRAGHAAASFLDAPARLLNKPPVEVNLGVAGIPLAPFAAGVSALGANHSRLPPEKLTEAETRLAQVMAVMADQRSFRDFVLKAGNERSQGSLLPAEPPDAARPLARPVSAVLETQVEELRLERTGKRDTSFALRVKVRARLLRADNNAVLYDYPVEYRSGTALFLDWTCQDAFRGVAETAYHELATRVAQTLLPANPEGPVFAGPGYKKTPASEPERGSVVVARQTPPSALIHFASAPAGTQGAVGVFAAATPAPVAIQTPLTKDDAVPAAMEEVNWSLDGLQNSRNPVILLGACVPAIPISLWHQAVIGIGCPSAKKYAAAEARLSAAVRQVRPQKDLSCAVASYLAQRTSQPVVLVEGTAPTGDGCAPTATAPSPRTPTGPDTLAMARRSHAGVTLCGVRGMRVRAASGKLAEGYVLGQGPDTALEIQVLSTALMGKGQANPSLAVCVEARARLLRVSDGQELFSGLVHYRSREHKYTTWAAHDARLFRQEMERCNRDLSRAAVDQLVARGLIAPETDPGSTLVADSK